VVFTKLSKPQTFIWKKRNIWRQFPVFFTWLGFQSGLPVSVLWLVILIWCCVGRIAIASQFSKHIFPNLKIWNRSFNDSIYSGIFVALCYACIYVHIMVANIHTRDVHTYIGTKLTKYKLWTAFTNVPLSPTVKLQDPQTKCGQFFDSMSFVSLTWPPGVNLALHGGHFTHSFTQR
jgi:hypothetical protein